LADEVIRLLAGAATAARLYPPRSELPAQAVERFVSRANEVTNAVGALRYRVDPHEIKIGEVTLRAGQNQITVFAETLHAMQVGQLVIAPGTTVEETHAFVEIANTDPSAVRQQGVRNMLMRAGVTHMAVIEVSLRSSDEEGFLGLDLTSAPLEDIGREAVVVAQEWSRTAAEGQGVDAIATAIGSLEEATRNIAAQRVADALLRLDEATRMRVLALSLRADTNGKRMEGMFDVIARMNPSALARLLTIVAAQAGTDPSRLAGAMDLPPEVAEQIALLLAPSPRTEAECGVPTEVSAADINEDMAAPGDTRDLQRQMTLSSPSLAAGRALATTVAISRVKPGLESVSAITDALPRAARDGAFQSTREALRRLDELEADPALALEVERARASLQDPEVLADVCQAPLSDSDAAIAGEILQAAGAAGGEALLSFFLTAQEPQRSLFRPVVRGMGEPLLNAAGRRIRTDDSTTVINILKMMPMLGDRRAVPVLVSALDNLDAAVRRAAVTALADFPGDEGKPALAKALSHWDPETRRFVIREIGRVHAVQAIPALVRILEDINFLERNHELKKEVIKSLESLGSPTAIPVLKRWANRPFVFGRKNKELRFLARRAVDKLSAEEIRNEGVDAQ